MKSSWLALMLLAAPLSVSAATGPDTTAVTARVHRFIHAINAGDAAGAVTSCTGSTTVIDEFPPFAWPTCADWWMAFGTFARAQGMSAPHVALGKLRHIAVDADSAYVVYPASFSFEQHGKRVHERHATMTLVLHKGTAGWHISTWSWAHP